MIDSAPGQLWSASNDFERVIFPRFPELATMKTALLRAGARQAGLSGSGSTVYALFAQGAAARQAATPWARVATVFLAETLTRERYQRALRLTEVLR
jgi:4-diphosphocytidyl-2C-methyl-D-erythritol kinase